MCFKDYFTNKSARELATYFFRPSGESIYVLMDKEYAKEDFENKYPIDTDNVKSNVTFPKGDNLDGRSNWKN